MLNRLLIFAALIGIAASVSCSRPSDHAANSSPTPAAAKEDVWQDARIIEYRPSTVSISVLKGWDVSIKDQVATMFSPDKKLTAVIYASPAKTFEEASSKSIEQVATFVDSAKNDGSGNKWETADGLSAINEQGIGFKNGSKVGWGSSLVKTTSKPLQIVWYFDPDDKNRDANLEQMRLMLNNIRKLANAKRTANTYIVD
jgi:hypothetical protein